MPESGSPERETPERKSFRMAGYPAAGGIVLCGGRSTRMGFAKAWLPFGPDLMLPRVVRTLGEAVGPRVVVAAPEQSLPPLPEDVRVVRDARPDRGPLEGLHAGLTALRGRVELVFVTSCDAPLLAPNFVRRVLESATGFEIAVPWIDGHWQPLAGAYRVSVAEALAELLAADQLRVAGLFDRVATRRITREELLSADPELRSLRNLNRPEDYFAALALAGFAAPPEFPSR